MRYFICAGLLIAWTLGMAQTQPEHTKRMFQDSDGKIYTHPDLPAYFFMSTKADASDKVAMTSESNPDKSNPMYFDGPGVHHLRHKDEVDKVEVNFLVYADDKYPVTRISYSDMPSFRNDAGRRFFGKNVEASLNAEDNMSGLDRVFHSVDGADFDTYTGSVSFDQEKEYTYRYYSLDKVGNAEEVHAVTFTVDQTAPETEYAINGDRIEDVLSPRASISMSATDALSGVKSIRWKIDEGAEKTYTQPIRISSLGQGEHTLTYYAVDEVDNAEEEHTYTFFLDNAPPIVAEDIIGDRYVVNGKEYASGRTKVRLTAIDNKAGVKAIYYKINDGDYEEYSESFYLPNRQGTADIKAYAVDKANNSNKRDNEGRSIRVTYVDLVGPTLSYKFNGPSFTTRDTVFVGPETKIELGAADDESGVNRITYKINGEGSEKDYDGPIYLKEEGVFTIEYFGYDNVNNRNVGDFFLRTDATGPELFPLFSVGPTGSIDVSGEKANVYPSYVVLFLSATDKLVGYDKLYYSINGGPEKLYSNPISGFKAGETYTIRIRGEDKLGNSDSIETTFGTERSSGSSQ